MKVYHHLAEIRKERGLTQKKIAEVIGVSEGTYGRYERRGGIRVSHIDGWRIFTVQAPTT